MRAVVVGHRRAIVVTRSARVGSSAMVRIGGGGRKRCKKERECCKDGLKMGFHG
jgi:hypothetical protein